MQLVVFLPILLLYNRLEDNKLFILIQFSRYIRMILFGFTLSTLPKLAATDVDRQINIIIITLTLLVYMSAGVFMIVENAMNLDQRWVNGVIMSDEQIYYYMTNLTGENFVVPYSGANFTLPSSPYSRLTIDDTFYFTIVTLSTVGYGDINPNSTPGKMFIIVIVIITIVLIPKQTSELLRLMNMQSKYRRAPYKYSEVRHIIVTGYVDLQALRNFCDELFHEDHGTLSTNAVILQPADPRPDMETYLQKQERNLTYLSGSPLDEWDLKRGDTHKSEACVLLTNKNSKSAEEEDHINILTALQLKKFVYDNNKDLTDETKHNIKICMQLIKPESKILYYKSLNLSPINDQLIIVEEIKMNLLAKSCFAPGLISLISNLFSTSSDIDTDIFEEEWLKEYATGMGHEVYRVQISEVDFQDSPTEKLTFQRVAEIAFQEYNAIAFALEIEIKNQQKSIIRLNPSKFEFC
mmetsp:Transcript_35561/g.34593  ORF Transcript_35561/g.34593 Transcript_35561/m.34593 type:complete len:466 (+) Transcript_35561:403-1800(+)